MAHSRVAAGSVNQSAALSLSIFADAAASPFTTDGGSSSGTAVEISLLPPWSRAGQAVLSDTSLLGDVLNKTDRVGTAAGAMSSPAGCAVLGAVGSVEVCIVATSPYSCRSHPLTSRG